MGCVPGIPGIHVADKLRRYRKKTAWKRCFVASGLVPDVGL